MLLQFTTTRRYSSMMLLDLHDIKRMKIIQIKRTINWIYLCKQISMQIVMEILLILVRPQTIIAIKHRKILLFLFLIIYFTQHNELYSHSDTRSQNNKTQSTMSDFLLFSFVRDIHYSRCSSIESHSTSTITKYVLTLNYI